MSAFAKILMTTDFSELSLGAVAPTLTLAQRFGSTVVLAYVQEERIPPFLEDLLDDHGDALERQARRATEELDRLAAARLGDQVKWTATVRTGAAAAEIVRLACE